jgi:hypothetical protein
MSGELAENESEAQIQDVAYEDFVFEQIKAFSHPLTK